jgi:hypothetical protein
MALTLSISVVALPTTGTDAASGQSTNNTYLAALDFGSDTTPLSVNDVVFEQVDPPDISPPTEWTPRITALGI